MSPTIDRARRCALAVVLTAAFTAATARAQERGTMADDPMLKIRDTYLSLVAQVPPTDFRPLPQGDALQDKAYFASLTWCGRVFRVKVHVPGDGVEHTYRVGRPGSPLDLFRHRLTVEGVPVRVYEASSFFLVFVPAAAGASHDAAAEAARAAGLLLALKSPPTFTRIAGDPAHRSYSTDQQRQAPGIGDWSRRIDAVDLGAELALVVYKATFDDMMTMISDPSAWFEELRAAK